MKKFLGIIFLTFIFSSNASANNLNNCNKVVTLLKNYGYNFQNFTSSKNIFIYSNVTRLKKHYSKKINVTKLKLF